MLREIASLPWIIALAAPVAHAGPADVVAARARCAAGGTCDFAVTVRHADTGWDHYADRWEVLGPDGEVLATRVLRHPHVDEQPFTRSLPGVALPEDVEEVTVRAHDKVHGLGGAAVRVRIERPEEGGKARRPPGDGDG